MNESRGDYTALLLDEGHSEDAAVLDRLRRDPAVVFVDRLEHAEGYAPTLVPTPDPGVLDETPVWAYYSWRRTVVRLLGPAAFRLLRLDRNRNKVTAPEQERLRDVTVGIVGLSVGHAVALALTLEGACGGLRLADFDTLELSNLNRVPGSVLDLGVNKAVVAARRIAEIDPYVTVTLWEDGLDVESVAEFLDGTDVVIDECDSLDVKVSLRREARRRGLPVLMATSDRGLLDVERFDLEPDRPIFHGVIGDVDVESLAGLGARDKIPLVLRILDATQLSATMAASLVEVDETISTWPQLGGEVLLGGGGGRGGGAAHRARTAAGVGSVPHGSGWASRCPHRSAQIARPAGGACGSCGGRSLVRCRRRRRECRGSRAFRRQRSAVGDCGGRGGADHLPGPDAHDGHGRRIPRQLCRDRRRLAQRPDRRVGRRTARRRDSPRRGSGTSRRHDDVRQRKRP